MDNSGLANTSGAIMNDALRYWEPRRIIYNLVLATVVVAWTVLTWPHFQPAFTLQSLLFILVLATVANACYCAVYLIDIPLQRSLKGIWLHRRWVLWIAGTLFSVVLECYWIADEIFPYVK